MKNSSFYRQAAWNVLGEGMWGKTAVTTLILLLIVFLAGVLPSMLGIFGDDLHIMSLSISLSSVVNLLFAYPLLYAFNMVFLQIYRRQTEESSPLTLTFANFRENYSALVGTFVLAMIVILFAFVFTILIGGIGGIVLGLAYALVPYIIHDNPNIGVLEALRKSRRMMRGHKWELFCLQISFIGWFFVGIFTFYIGFLWIVPYINTATAAFYEDVKAE